ncbi:MAG: 50S ribosome-binding GTPase [Candidatus Hydrogenedentes bacterium]|nr:50S ribosome-binding GTPase [Candidatus Hydrogenedentota bacterium]
MSSNLSSILARLDELAAYDGPWRPLRDEIPLLRTRLHELREREMRMDDLLVVALVGGSGVGKSTFLNALAGDQLAATSEYRPCTSVPCVYQPPGAAFGPAEWNRVYGSALENLVIIDTPDSDTIARHHRDMVGAALTQCDLIMICGSPEKYLDEATWSLLRPLRDERTLVCVETKADTEAESIREHWLARLHEQGFAPREYFRVSARRTLDRKLTGRLAGHDEFDFPRLEAYLRSELSTEQVRRIKRSNAYGLLAKTLATLHERVGARAEDLEALGARLSECDKKATKETCARIGSRLFAEPHLWNFALGREVSLRAKGVVWTAYRVLEALRTLPARVAGVLRWIPRESAGRQAVALLSEQSLLSDDVDIVTPDVRDCYGQYHSELAVHLARAGFAHASPDAGFDAFSENVRHRLAVLLRGPARDRIVARARLLTSWPATFLADALPVVFVAYAGYRIVNFYFAGITLTGDYFLHAGAVLAILLGVELLVLSTLSRFFAWSARASATRDLRTSLLAGGIAFAPERKALEDALAAAQAIETLRGELAAGRTEPTEPRAAAVDQPVTRV